MSGWSDSFTCPNCGSENTECSGDYKPIDCSSGICFDCGFYYSTITGYNSIEELNELRIERGDKPLIELPKQDEI